VAQSINQACTDSQVKIPNCKRHQNDNAVADRSLFCKYVMVPARVCSRHLAVTELKSAVQKSQSWICPQCPSKQLRNL